MSVGHLPLYARVLIGVVLGAAVGMALRDEYTFAGIDTTDLGQLGMLVIRVLKMLAVPLVLFAVIDAIIKSDDITGRSGAWLVAICLINVTVAFTIGLTLMNLFEPGLAMYGELDKLAGGLPQGRTPPPGATLSPLDNIDKWIPESVAGPFTDNNVISVVLLAIMAGAAIRSVRKDPEAAPAMTTVAQFIDGANRVVVRMLTWVIAVVPFAVFGVVANVVGKAGVEVFKSMWTFLVIIIAGFAIHAFLY
jgi:DAACS family dicarboxylate/amino acid:cation (Na+ or H+) symporter